MQDAAKLFLNVKLKMDDLAAELIAERQWRRTLQHANDQAVVVAEQVAAAPAAHASAPVLLSFVDFDEEKEHGKTRLVRRTRHVVVAKPA